MFNLVCFSSIDNHSFIQGGINAVAELLIADHRAFGTVGCTETSISIRKFIGMSLTNLTYGDLSSKKILCSIGGFLDVVVAMIESPHMNALREVC